jgi:hypothetical protein
MYTKRLSENWAIVLDSMAAWLTLSMVLKSLPVSSLRLFFSSLGLEAMTVLRS